MLRIVRFLVVVLLTLGVPLQGFAAVAAGQCMAFEHHHDGAAQDSQAHDHDGTDGHEHAAAQDHGDKAAHCGPCTACCASASIAGAARLAIPTSPSHTKYLFFQSAPPGFLPDGVDRPPLAL